MLLKDLWLDVKAVQERDPAARSALEVLLLYQGVHALIWHRIAHWFWTHNMRFLGRLISQIARFFTLIEIHPGAVLGHGIGNNVLIGAGAMILGAFEVGDNCQIAANAVLLKPLEENSTAAGIPARQVKKDGLPVKDPAKKVNMEHICKIQDTIDELERRVRELEKELEEAKKEL